MAMNQTHEDAGNATCADCGVPLTGEYVKSGDRYYCLACWERRSQTPASHAEPPASVPLQPEIRYEAPHAQEIDREVERELQRRQEERRQAQAEREHEFRRKEAIRDIVVFVALFFVGTLIGTAADFSEPAVFGLAVACVPAGWRYVDSFWGTTFVFGSCGIALLVTLLELGLKLLLSFFLGIFVAGYRLIRAIINLVRKH